MTAPAPRPDPRPDPPADPLPGRALGVFAVRVDPGKLAAFRAAIGDKGPGVPLGYPMIWLASAGVRAALGGALGGALAEGTLVHLGQGFRIHQPLQVGRAYKLELALEGPGPGGQFRLSGRLWRGAGLILALESHLALFRAPVA